MLAERLRASGRQFVDVLEHALDRVELLDELRRRLVADTRNAGDRIGRVALEADEVGHLLRRHSEPRRNSLGRIDVDVGDTARRHHEADVVRYKLKCVAVGRDDARGHARAVGTGRERGDDVVRLPPFELEVPVAAVSYTHLKLPTNREV